MEGEITTSFEDSTPQREHEIQVGRIPKCRGSDPNATSRGCTTTTNPTAAMQFDLIASRRINPHRFITVRWEEQMSMISGQDAMLDARRGKLPEGPGQIVD